MYAIAVNDTVKMVWSRPEIDSIHHPQTRHGAQLEVTKSIADNGNTPRLYATKIGTERKRRAPKISSRAPEVVGGSLKNAIAV